VIGVIWFRHHNWLARRLSEENPDWLDDRVFNEARIRNVATFQVKKESVRFYVPLELSFYLIYLFIYFNYILPKNLLGHKYNIKKKLTKRNFLKIFGSNYKSKIDWP